MQRRAMFWQAALTPCAAGTALSALLRKNKLRQQTSIDQAALKVVPAQGEVVATY